MKKPWKLYMELDLCCPSCSSENVADCELGVVGINHMSCNECGAKFTLQILAIQHTDKTPSGVRAMLMIKGATE
jgi:transposase-like protein